MRRPIEIPVRAQNQIIRVHAIGAGGSKGIEYGFYAPGRNLENSAAVVLGSYARVRAASICGAI
jgi:hypothetical protein